MKRILIVALSFILIAFIACDAKKKENTETPINAVPEIDSNIILFPNIRPDSTFIIGNKLKLTFIDSMSLYNAVSSNQAVFMYAMQMEKPIGNYDTILFHIKMPNRENPLIEFPMSIVQYNEMEKSFGNYQFKQFLKELLKLNYSSKDRYSNKASTLLDGLNMIFAQKIDSSFSKQVPNNSTLFGYNSFVIFGMYFNEVAVGKPGIGHELIKAIPHSQKRLNEFDKKTVMELILKHSENFKPKAS